MKGLVWEVLIWKVVSIAKFGKESKLFCAILRTRTCLGSVTADSCRNIILYSLCVKHGFWERQFNYRVRRGGENKYFFSLSRVFLFVWPCNYFLVARFEYVSSAVLCNACVSSRASIFHCCSEQNSSPLWTCQTFVVKRLSCTVLPSLWSYRVAESTLSFRRFLERSN